ncbi:MAG: histone deacetylase, partial [Planctomycetota bacterium]
RVHDADYVRGVEAAIARGARVLDEGDTRVSADSYRAALAAAGGAVRAVEGVIDGTWRNAFVAVRPPGHHAERGTAMGFCLFNSAAVAAAHARAALGLERVAILDWDVHHGNGTQHLFEEDGQVFFASLHQWPLYPGTGLARERGRGAGVGATLNCPQEPGSGDREWLGAFEGTVLPAVEAFRPELVIVSAGFDAHERDPLAQTRLSTAAFRTMTESVLEVARKCCRGRVVTLLEGGYDLEALADCVEAHVGALAAAPEVT